MHPTHSCLIQKLQHTLRLLPLILVCLTLSSHPSLADEVTLQPFTATYAVTYRGMGAGTLQTQLQRDPQTGHLSFETRVNPSFLARFAISRNAIERSVMELTGEGVRPLQWSMEDGKKTAAGDGAMTFDWAQNSVNGDYKGAPIALNTEAGLQDRQSMQIQVIYDLLHGREPGALPMINDDEIKQYTYTRGSSTELQTKLGKIDAVVFESTRTGSNRVSRVWHAPSLGYVPVRAEQVRKGKIETVMTLIALERGLEK